MPKGSSQRKATVGALSAPVVEVPMTEAPDVLADLVACARKLGQRTLLLRYGKQVAAIVPISDYERLKMTA